eukprot:CAMPEP_0117434896 /NCGR_PEP_ID=MMETSP0759-20121206/190_1 /TAXON_ID=63605 /ORGANISM="Percolomonas cosmopolitus, Strain WS" /LENGTH=150 /DNA_ID=CAMNT_0005226403 /DNA_START=189 /DNA_END=641 /DNA_ORIENTATION=+
MYNDFTHKFKHVYNSRSELPKPSVVKDWKKELNDFDYLVLRQQGTERAGTGKYCSHDQEGVYKCKACKTPLFTSEGKFPCSCGWPSFFEPVNDDAITYIEDKSHGMSRIETICSSCHSHLGHIFPDGPSDKGGRRYCINSVCLEFEKKNL